MSLIRTPASRTTVEKVRSDYGWYIKFVVDIERKILAAGGEYTYEQKDALLAVGSKESALWGGGLDVERNLLEYDAIINIKPKINNSNLILDPKVCAQVAAVVRSLLPAEHYLYDDEGPDAQDVESDPVPAPIL